MIGKKNIVFGWVFLVFTAALGPYMVGLYTSVGSAQQVKQAALGKLQLVVDSGFEDEQTLEPMSAEAIARLNAKAILALNGLHNARAPIDEIKGGPHAHGNLEALLNIAVGLVLCFVAANVWFKQLVSGLFILGTLLHSGLLYLRAFDMAWAGRLLELGIGPLMILLGLLLAAIIVVIGFREDVVKDT